jgi:hypothetical protein
MMPSLLTLRAVKHAESVAVVVDEICHLLMCSHRCLHVWLLQVGPDAVQLSDYVNYLICLPLH